MPSTESPLPAARPPILAFPGAERAPATLGELFRVFTVLALQGFGGVLAVAQHHLVEGERWMTTAQFVEMLSIGQVLPGPNIINLSLMVGDRFFGWRGAIVAVVGLLAAPLVIVLAAAALYSEFAYIAPVAGALRGMGAVAAGLVVATALKLMRSLKTNPMGPWLCGAFTLVTLVGIVAFHWPLVWVVLGLGTIACGCAWWRLREAALAVAKP